MHWRTRHPLDFKTWIKKPERAHSRTLSLIWLISILFYAFNAAPVTCIQPSLCSCSQKSAECGQYKGVIQWQLSLYVLQGTLFDFLIRFNRESRFFLHWESQFETHPPMMKWNRPHNENFYLTFCLGPTGIHVVWIIDAPSFRSNPGPDMYPEICILLCLL